MEPPNGRRNRMMKERMVDSAIISALSTRRLVLKDDVIKIASSK
ncbi:unknown [Clostridium sp. CAG:169]|nr:unknown [Clostridium sp. CAG:169]